MKLEKTNMVHIGDIKSGECFRTREEGEDSTYMKVSPCAMDIFCPGIDFPAVDIETGEIFSFLSCKVEPVGIIARESRGE